LGSRRRQFFELADIAANARRGKNAVAISPIALEAVKRIDMLFDIERDINWPERRRALAPRAKCAPSGRSGSVVA
jgi:transposase